MLSRAQTEAITVACLRYSLDQPHPRRAMGRLIHAYAWVLDQAHDRPPGALPTVDDLHRLAALIEPDVNPAGLFRTGPSVFDQEGNPEPVAWQEVPHALHRLWATINTAGPDLVAHEIGRIPPLRDAN